MDAETEEIHQHCLNCIKYLKCSVVPKPGVSCEIVACPLACGARFHACKLSEHKLLCMNEKVPCINAEYGCPSLLKRKHRGTHLFSCPASIVFCSEVWDRWPIHSHDTKRFLDSSYHTLAAEDHLDIALASRDKRMLDRWLVAAKSNQPVGEHHFKMGYDSCSWFYTKWNCLRKHIVPGLWPNFYDGICSFCFQNSVSIPYLVSTVAKSTTEDAKDSEAEEKNHDSNNGKSEDDNAEGSSSTASSKLSEQCGYLQYTFDDVFLLSQFRLVDCEPVSSFKAESFLGSEMVNTYMNHIGLNNNNKMICEVIDFRFRNPVATPPWCSALGFDLSLESHARRKAESFMYTFSCFQIFRRDEYGWHHKNVHSDIHAGLNGWLIDRCPLAQYGCKYARKRLVPAQQNAVVVFSEALESFGVTVSPNRNGAVDTHLCAHSWTRYKNRLPCDMNITRLPFFVLQKIISHLDSFSLCNLALTCTALREVCSNFVKQRGMVILMWEKSSEDNKWHLSNQKKWLFSTHFTPIQKWNFDDSTMLNHLKCCKYFVRTENTKPFKMFGT